MARTWALRAIGAIALIGTASAALALNSGESEALGQSPVRNGKAGFVVSHIRFALGPDASASGACPAGLSRGYARAGDPFERAAGATPTADENVEATLENVLGRAIREPELRNFCQNPELAPRDPLFRTISGVRVADGIDMDGRTSRRSGAASPNTCAHDDFRSASGAGGIDNQFWRAMGCSESFQSTGQSNGFEVEMLTGAWGILIELDGVDDLRNDPDVAVMFVANADPIALSPAREALANATYAMDQDHRYRATTRGRIVNGVLTTDPVDLRFHKSTNGIRLDRMLNDARARITFTSTGGLEGYLAGYVPVDEMYDSQFAFRNGRDANGDPAPLRLRTVSSLGSAMSQNRTCQGVYQALQALADGDRDENGRCHSISTQYHITAVPAFLVDMASESSNADLERHETTSN